MRLTEFKTGDIQFDLDGRRQRFITDNGEARDWEDCSDDYVFTQEEAWKVAGIPPELIAYVPKHLKEFLSMVDGKPIALVDITLNVVRILPSIFMAWFRDFHKQVKEKVIVRGLK